MNMQSSLQLFEWCWSALRLDKQTYTPNSVYILVFTYYINYNLLIPANNKNHGIILHKIIFANFHVKVRLNGLTLRYADSINSDSYTTHV